MAGMYAVYHGPDGLRRIAERVHLLTSVLREGLRRLGYVLDDSCYFDTFSIDLNLLKESSYIRNIEANQQPASPPTPDDLLTIAHKHRINFRVFDHSRVGISLDETTTIQEVRDLLDIFALGNPLPFAVEGLALQAQSAIPQPLQRKSAYLTHPVFNTYHSETELLRYIHKLQEKDLSLTTSMIPLGSCTMKLNGTAEMLAVTWPEFSQPHPFAPLEQTKGYQILFEQLEAWLAELTGFPGISLQPNAGSQGEYAGASSHTQIPSVL